MDEINLANQKHLGKIFDFLVANTEEAWLSDVTLACADGDIQMNRLIVGIIFPDLEGCRRFSDPGDIYIIVPDLSKGDVRLKTERYIRKQNIYDTSHKSYNLDDEEVYDGDDGEEFFSNTYLDKNLNDAEEIKVEPDQKEIRKEESAEYKQTVTCDKCQMHFSSDEFLYKHVQYNHVAMQCQICQESQPSWLHLTEHVKIHAKASNLSGYPCKKCSKTFPTQVLLENHVTIYHSVKKRYICEDCGKSFESNSKLSEHNNIHHLKVKPYNCKDCSYSAATLQTLNQHVKAVHIGLKFTCSVCGKVFNHRGSLTVHERTHSEDRKTYPCTYEFCDKVYVKKNSLRDHIDECHSSPKCIKCEICTSEFKCLRSLKTHMKVHDENTALKCTLCDKRFSTNQQLTYHMNSHTGNKPFKCELCSSCYSSHSSLYHHKKSCAQKFL